MSECKDYVIGREITTVLKITVDYAILELCDSCDFFASPLINIFLLVLVLDSKGIINTIKNVWPSATECAYVAAVWQTRSCLLSYYLLVFLFFFFVCECNLFYC